MQASADWSFNVDANGIHGVLGPNGLVATKGMLVIGRRIERVAKEMCPVDRGRLRSSIAARLEVGDGGLPVVIVGTNVEYAAFVHEGTGLFGPRHAPITPKNGNALVFKVAGRTVFARSVKGAPGRPFLRTAMEQVVGSL